MNDRRERRESIGRRELLEWIGGATVLGLGSPLIAACRQDVLGGSQLVDLQNSQGDGDAPTDSTTGQPDAERGDSASCGANPGTLTRPDLQSWKEATVDPQDLTSLLTRWNLRIDGLVDQPLQADFCSLLALGLSRQVTDFHCVEGWSVWDVPWDGIPLRTLLERVRPHPGATHLKIHCVGGKYYEQLPVAVATESRSLLALGVDGATLPLAHGFPCRVVVPRLQGYKNAKYVERIELVDYEPPTFWSSYGYSIGGEVPVDRLRNGKY